MQRKLIILMILAIILVAIASYFVYQFIFYKPCPAYATATAINNCWENVTH